MQHQNFMVKIVSRLAFVALLSCGFLTTNVLADWFDDFESAAIGDTLGNIGYSGEYALQTVEAVGADESKGVFIPTIYENGWPGAWVDIQLGGLVNVGDSLEMSVDVQMEVADRLRVDGPILRQLFELQIFGGDSEEFGFALSQMGILSDANPLNYALANFDFDSGVFEVGESHPVSELGLNSMEPGELSDYITFQMNISKTGDSQYEYITSIFDPNGNLLASLQNNEFELDDVFRTGEVSIRFGHFGGTTHQYLKSLRFDNFQYQVTPVTEVILPPETVTITRGSLANPSIDVSRLATSDNVDFSIRRASVDIQSVTEFEAAFVSPSATPTSIDVSLEGSVFSRTEVTQTIEIFDFVSQAWVELDSSPASRFNDSTVTASYSGDISRVVDTNQQVNLRIRYQSAQARQQFTSNTDQLSVTFGL